MATPQRARDDLVSIAGFTPSEATSYVNGGPLPARFQGATNPQTGQPYPTAGNANVMDYTFTPEQGTANATSYAATHPAGTVDLNAPDPYNTSTSATPAVAPVANPSTDRRFLSVDSTPQGWDVAGYSGALQGILAKNPTMTQDQLNAAMLQMLAESRLAGGSNDRTMYESPEMEAVRKNALRTYNIGQMETAEQPKIKRATLGAFAERGLGQGGLVNTGITDALGRAKGEWADRQGSAYDQALGNVLSRRAGEAEKAYNMESLNLQRDSNELVRQQAAAATNAANAKTGFASWGPAVTKWWGNGGAKAFNILAPGHSTGSKGWW